MKSQHVKGLLIRIEKGERQAFDELFDHYYPRLLKFAKHYVKTYEDAEEVVMDVFVKLLKRKNKLTKIDNFNRYIFLSVKNQSISLLTKSKPELFRQEDEEDFIIIEYANPESKLIDQELLQVFRETIENLPIRRKTVYKLIKEDGLQYKEVAKLMNISPKTVEVHIGLAISSIRNSISNYFIDKEKAVPVRKLLP